MTTNLQEMLSAFQNQFQPLLVNVVPSGPLGIVLAFSGECADPKVNKWLKVSRVSRPDRKGWFLLPNLFI